MTREECYYLGKITKTFGNDGGLSIYLDVDDPGEYEELDAVFVDFRGNFIPYFIDKIQLHTSKKTAVVFFEDVDDVETATKLVNSTLHLPLSTLPKLEGNKFYFHEVTGFMLVDEQVGELAPITEILDYPQQALFSIKYKNREVLIPVNNEIIKEVDRAQKTIRIKLPEGLLDVYLEEHKNDE